MILHIISLLPLHPATNGKSSRPFFIVNHKLGSRIIKLIIPDEDGRLFKDVAVCFLVPMTEQDVGKSSHLANL